MRIFFISILKLYKWIGSPVAAALGAQCRFYPSCADYTIMAFKKWGCWKGFELMIRRLVKCHPAHRGGIDLI